MTRQEYILMLADQKKNRDGLKKVVNKKRYHGEENENVTLKDCEAANMKFAKLNAGQISLDDFVVPAPKNIPVIVV